MWSRESETRAGSREPSSGDKAAWQSVYMQHMRRRFIQECWLGLKIFHLPLSQKVLARKLGFLDFWNASRGLPAVITNTKRAKVITGVMLFAPYISTCYYMTKLYNPLHLLKNAVGCVSKSQIKLNCNNPILQLHLSNFFISVSNNYVLS